MTPKTTSITTVAKAFFEACETGKGWDVCSAYCTPDATFSAQAEPLLDVKTLAQYTDWMKGMLTVLPDGHYELKSFATDSARNNVAAYQPVSKPSVLTHGEFLDGHTAFDALSAREQPATPTQIGRAQLRSNTAEKL